MGMTLEEFELLSHTCWVENYQELNIDMTKAKLLCSYRLGLNSIFNLHSSPF